MSFPNPSPLFISESLVPSRPTPVSSSTVLLDFDGLLNPPLKLREHSKEVGGQLWPAGMVLARYLLRCQMDLLSGKTIVELGAGSGLVGLALALKSPNLTVHLTDLPIILPTLQHNSQINQLLSPVYPSVLSWGEPASSSSLPSTPDIVLAADCVYFEPAFPLLLATMQDLVGDRTICYFCIKKRRRADMGFLNKLKKVFQVKEVEDDPDRKVWEKQRIFLYEVRKRVPIEQIESSQSSTATS